jgi:DNA-binding SARP family transcriptional activator
VIGSGSLCDPPGTVASSVAIVHFDVLGPLRVSNADGRVAVPGRQTAAALCWLVLNANEPVSIDSLVSVLWTRPLPTAPAKARLLARSLGPLLDQATLEVGDHVRLVTSDDAVDARRFERLFREGRSQLATGDTSRGRANVEEALALWRGDPYPGLDRALPALAEIDRLADLRLDAIETLNSLLLAEPVDYPLVAELRAQVILYPDRPRLRRQLALALYRTDRQVEALEIVRSQGVGRDDGDGPAAALQAAILRHDPQLAQGELPVT